MSLTLSDILNPELEARGLMLWRRWKQYDDMSCWVSPKTGLWICYVFKDEVDIRKSFENPDSIVIKASDPDFLNKTFEALEKFL